MYIRKETNTSWENETSTSTHAHQIQLIVGPAEVYTRSIYSIFPIVLQLDFRIFSAY